MLGGFHISNANVYLLHVLFVDGIKGDLIYQLVITAENENFKRNPDSLTHNLHTIKLKQRVEELEEKHRKVTLSKEVVVNFNKGEYYRVIMTG